MPTESEILPRLKAFIRADMERTDISGCALKYGHDWFNLSEAEAEVFGLTLDMVPSLLSIWCAFKAALDIAYPGKEYDYTFFAEVREALPWIGEKAKTHQLHNVDFVRFAQLMGMPARHATAWFYKRHFQDARSGIVYYADDPKPPGNNPFD